MSLATAQQATMGCRVSLQHGHKQASRLVAVQRWIAGGDESLQHKFPCYILARIELPCPLAHRPTGCPPHLACSAPCAPAVGPQPQLRSLLRPNGGRSDGAGLSHSASWAPAVSTAACDTHARTLGIFREPSPSVQFFFQTLYNSSMLSHHSMLHDPHSAYFSAYFDTLPCYLFPPVSMHVPCNQLTCAGHSLQSALQLHARIGGFQTCSTGPVRCSVTWFELCCHRCCLRQAALLRAPKGGGGAAAAMPGGAMQRLSCTKKLREQCEGTEGAGPADTECEHHQKPPHTNTV